MEIDCFADLWTFWFSTKLLSGRECQSDSLPDRIPADSFKCIGF